MAFGATPKDAVGTPLGSVYTPGTANSDLTALEGGPVTTDGNNQKSAPVSTYTKDGSDLSAGATTDAAVIGDVAGSRSAKLRGLSKLWNDVWDSVNHRIKVDGSGVTQPVSAASLPLPSGAALEAGNLATSVTRLNSILTALQGLLQVEQADLSTTGTISAAQPLIGTPVANATVVLALGQGQSTWKAQLLAGTGGFTSGTTIVADKSPDGGTTWYSSAFKVAGAAINTPVSSVVGPGPIEITGNAASISHIRIRVSVLNSTETVAVTIRSGAGVSEVGLMSSIPAGSNLIGYVEDIEQANYIAATTPPSITNVGTDTTYTFSSQVNRIIIQNNTTANVYFAFDTAASAGSLLVVPGALLVYPKKCTVLHLFTAAAQNINGTTIPNIVVLGAL